MHTARHTTPNMPRHRVAWQSAAVLLATATATAVTVTVDPSSAVGEMGDHMACIAMDWWPDNKVGVCGGRVCVCARVPVRHALSVNWARCVRARPLRIRPPAPPNAPFSCYPPLSVTMVFARGRARVSLSPLLPTLV